jgi:hypothetical protein
MNTLPDRARHPNRRPNFTHVATEDGQGIDTYPGKETTALYLSGHGGEAASHDMGYHSFRDPDTLKSTPYIDASVHALQKEHEETGREFPVSGNVIGKLGNKRISDLEDSSSYGGDLVDKK